MVTIENPSCCSPWAVLDFLVFMSRQICWSAYMPEKLLMRICFSYWDVLLVDGCFIGSIEEGLDDTSHVYLGTLAEGIKATSKICRIFCRLK